MPIKFHEGSKTFHIYNKHLSYITCIMENGQMENLYYGKAIRDKEDFSYLHEEIMLFFLCRDGHISFCIFA